MRTVVGSTTSTPFRSSVLPDATSAAPTMSDR